MACLQNSLIVITFDKFDKLISSNDRPELWLKLDTSNNYLPQARGTIVSFEAQVARGRLIL